MPKYGCGGRSTPPEAKSASQLSSVRASNGAKKSVALERAVGLHLQAHDRLAEARRRRRCPAIGAGGCAAVAGAEQDACPSRRRRCRRPTARCPRRCRSGSAGPARLDLARRRHAEDPALPGRDVAVRAERGVDDAVHQQQARAAAAAVVGSKVCAGAFCAVALEPHREAGALRRWTGRARPCTSARPRSCPTRRSCGSDRRCWSRCRSPASPSRRCSASGRRSRHPPHAMASRG